MFGSVMVQYWCASAMVKPHSQFVGKMILIKLKIKLLVSCCHLLAICLIVALPCLYSLEIYIVLCLFVEKSDCVCLVLYDSRNIIILKSLNLLSVNLIVIQYHICVIYVFYSMYLQYFFSSIVLFFECNSLHHGFCCQIGLLSSFIIYYYFTLCLSITSTISRTLYGFMLGYFDNG